MEAKCKWKSNILQDLQQRNYTISHTFQDLITLQNKIFENANVLRSENLQLSVQNEKLRYEALERGGASERNSVIENHYQDRIQQLEHKLLHQQEELTELHRRKGENAQQIIDLSSKLQNLEKQLSTKDMKILELQKEKAGLTLDTGRFEKSIKELKHLNETLRDEYQSSQLALTCLEEKLRKTQDENRQLVERLIKYKANDADRLNEQNDNFLREDTKNITSVLSTFGLFRKRYAKMQKELEDACRDSRSSTEDYPETFVPVQEFSMPSKATMKFDAHDGEVNAVKWSPMDRVVATGGADRKVKLWDVTKGHHTSKGMLVGSNAGVMSVDFDSTGSYILAASNDYATRVWTLDDQRLRHTLTGHSGKVMAAKFLGEGSKVVTGSHDRTLKIWDLKSRACTETKFAGSSCNDLVTVDGSGSTIISGHFDKSIRFWDTRSEASANNIILNGKVTSLDLTKDATYLLCCVRDDTLKLLDLRMSQIVNSFSCDGFKVGCDWTRATFSPDKQYVSVGSYDGTVFIWNINTGKVEASLREHTSPVTATGWHPYGLYLASVDKSKKAIIWASK